MGPRAHAVWWVGSVSADGEWAEDGDRGALRLSCAVRNAPTTRIHTGHSERPQRRRAVSPRSRIEMRGERRGPPREGRCPPHARVENTQTGLRWEFLTAVPRDVATATNKLKMGFYFLLPSGAVFHS